MRMLARAAAVLALGALTAAGLSGTPAAAAPAPASSAQLIPYGKGATAVEQRRTAVAAHADVSAQAVDCWYNVTIYANANGRWVSMEKGYGGGDYAMLRARATAIGPWEYYVVCRDSGSGYTTFASQDNQLAVSTEIGYGGGDNGMLRARASAIGPWEQYYSSSAPGGAWIALYAYANNRWVSTEIGYGGGDNGMLRARATAIGPWEQYYW